MLPDDTRQNPSRPWDSPEHESGWDAYGAWESWMSLHLDGMVPESAGSAFDRIDAYDRAFLYSLMCRLADGEFGRKAVSP